MSDQRIDGWPPFSILGPLRVLGKDGALVPLGGPRARELLALLLIHPNTPLSSDRLVDLLWGDQAGKGAATTLRTHIAAVRRVLDAAGLPDALAHRSGGYALALDPVDLDAELFERLVHRGQEALALGEADEAAALLGRAGSLWRGEPLADLGPPPFAEGTATRLGELHLVAEETAIAAALAQGRHREVVGRLQELVAAHPFREGFCGQLMVALYRSGRQVDALAAYAETKQRLEDELGLDPTPELQQLLTAMLRQDASLMPPGPSARPGVWASTPSTATVSVAEPADAVYTALRRSAMVGRQHELGALTDLWGEVDAGGRSVVAVSGPVGVGKSRLVAELANTARDDGATVLVGRCDDTLPHAALASALAGSGRAVEVVRRAPRGVQARLRPLLPPVGEPVPPRGDDGDPQSLVPAVAWLLGELATEPLLLVVEDAEQLDEPAAATLRALAPRLPLRTLLVLCFRDPPGTRHLPLAGLLAQGGVRELTYRVRLAALDKHGLAELVRTVYPDSGPSADGLAEELWHQTGGNPFFAREVLRDLDPELVRAGRLGQHVPAEVRDVLRHRLAALPEDTRSAVAAAAVLGRDVELSRLSRLLGETEDDAVAVLHHAVAGGFLVEAGQSWSGGYAFPHELMRDAVYADISPTRRRRLHLAAVDAIFAGPASEVDVLAAATHMLDAGSAADPAEAAALVERATRLAVSSFGFEAAIRLAERRLPLLDQCATPAQRADALVALARLRLRAGRDYDRVVELLEHALEIYLSVGDTESAGLVHSRLGGTLAIPHPGMDVGRSLEHLTAAERLLPSADEVFHLHRGRMSAAMHAIDVDTLGAAAERCAAIADAAGRHEFAAAAGWGRGWCALDLGHPAEALHVLDGAWTAVRDLGDPLLVWPPTNAAAMICTVYLLDPDAGRAWCRRGLGQPRFDALTHPHDALADQLVLALAETGELEAARRAAEALPPEAVGRRMVRFLSGEWERAAGEWRAALAHDLTARDHHDAVLNARWLADALIALGEEHAAEQALRTALDIATSAPQLPTEVWLRARLAGLTVTPLHESGDHLARCEDVVTGGEDWRGLTGEVALARAAVAVRRDDLATAEDAALGAAGIFAAYRLPWRRAAALRLASSVLARGGRPDEAAARHGEADDILLRIGAPDRWRVATSRTPDDPGSTRPQRATITVET